MDDLKIVEMFWNRNEDALRETEAKYGAYCHSIAYSILSNRADSEECVNDTFLRAWDSIPPHRPSMLRGFLGKLTRNLALDRYRKYSAEKRAGLRVTLVLDELKEGLAIRDSSEKVVEAIVVGDLLNRFLATLPKDTKNVFMRRYWFFSSVSEIAHDLSVSKSSVKMTLMRTRKKLREFLESEGFSYEI